MVLESALNKYNANDFRLIMPANFFVLIFSCIIFKLTHLLCLWNPYLEPRQAICVGSAETFCWLDHEPI